MAADNALFTHTGSTDSQHGRLSLGGLLAVQGPTAHDIRTGVLVGPGSRTLITGTSSTAPMRVSIAPHGWVSSRGAANGAYLGKLPAATLVDIAAAPGSGTRIDVVFEKQADSTPGVPSPDATTAPTYGVKTGTVGAGKPTITDVPGAHEIGTVTVVAGATRTDSAGVTIANTARQTTTRGGIVPVANAAELALLTAYPTLQALELDTARRRWHDGTRWRYEGDRVAVTSIAERDALTAYEGLTAFVATQVGGTFVYAAGAWVALGKPTEWASNPYTFNVPVTGTPQVFPALAGQPGADASFSVVVPVGRTLTARLQIPSFTVPSGSTAQIRLVAAGVIDGAAPSTGTGVAIAWPIDLTVKVIGTGAAVSVTPQAWTSNGTQASAASSTTSAAPVRLSYEIN